MAPTVSAMREGLVANLSTLDGRQIVPYMLGAPTPPTIQVFPETVEYDRAMHRGYDAWTFVVQAFAGLTTDRGAQISVDEMLEPSGSNSIKAAVESDKTLGGIVSDVRVVSATGYRVYPSDGGAVLGCEWTVYVIAPGA